MFSQGWVGSLIGIIGLIIALILYRASRIGARPVYQLRSLGLIGKGKQLLPEEVEILFRGMSIPRLTMTHVILWNSGKTTLYGKDIVIDDPLRLEFSKGAEILRARVPKVTREANKFTAKIRPHSRNQVVCSFDYLDAGDGGVVELLHTDEERYPRVLGTIRGVPKGVLNWGHIPVYERHISLLLRKIGKVAPYVSIFFGIFLSSIVFISPMILQTSQHPKLVRWLFLIAGLTYIFTASGMLWTIRRRFPKSLAVEDIE